MTLISASQHFYFATILKYICQICVKRPSALQASNKWKVTTIESPARYHITIYFIYFIYCWKKNPSLFKDVLRTLIFENNSYQLPTSTCCFPIGFLERLNGKFVQLGLLEACKGIIEIFDFKVRLLWSETIFRAKKTYAFLTLLCLGFTFSWWTICNQL